MLKAFRFLDMVTKNNVGLNIDLSLILSHQLDIFGIALGSLFHFIYLLII